MFSRFSEFLHLFFAYTPGLRRLSCEKKEDVPIMTHPLSDNSSETDALFTGWG